MNSFLVGLQFLTRIHISNETVWKDEEFGKSVIWFPVYGWIIGAFMCLIYFLLKPLDMPYLTAFLIVLGELFISGGTLADGLMDSSDGLFSGRSRERCLEIMKDSLIGSFGMLSIIIFINLYTLSLGSIDGLLYPILIAAPALGPMAWAKPFPLIVQSMQWPLLLYLHCCRLFISDFFMLYWPAQPFCWGCI